VSLCPDPKKTISFSGTESLHLLLKEWAWRERLSVSAFLRRLLLAEAKRRENENSEKKALLS
jgi:hypothetical protein